uniref:Uncharacterized protein n=1 Tax=viral metagenome TaxID=1070528 RepID=A0A6C0I3Z4_9ZZZZ
MSTDIERIIDIVKGLFQETEKVGDEFSVSEIEKIYEVIQHLFKKKEEKEVGVGVEKKEEVGVDKKEEVGVDKKEEVGVDKKEEVGVEKDVDLNKNVQLGKMSILEPSNFSLESVTIPKKAPVVVDEYNCQNLLNDTEKQSYETIAVYIDENTEPNTHTCVFKNKDDDEMPNIKKTIA